jgi:hypothetical protein
VPSVSENLAADPTVIGSSARAAGLDTMVAMPVIERGRFKAIVAWYF